MPPLNEKLTQNFYLRELLYGPPKSKKTWWCGRAAEAGYNVIIIDGDKGYHILKNIPEKYRHKIQVVEAGDSLGDPAFAVFLTLLCKGSPFVWSEKYKNKVTLQTSCKEDSAHYFIDPTQFDENTLLVIDSWTALSWSLAWRYAAENNIDLSDAEKVEWEGYRWTGTLANWMLAQLKEFKCHLAVVAHRDQYEKRKSDGKTVEWSRTQIKSVSGNHAMQVPVHFSDILRFEVIGSNIKIDTRAEKDKEGGSRIVPPNSYDWDKLQFVDIIKLAGLNLPNGDEDCLGCKYFPAGTIPDFTELSIGSKALNAIGGAGKITGIASSATSAGKENETASKQAIQTNGPVKKASFSSLMQTKK